MASNRIFNFSAGPAVLPEAVIERAQKALWNLNDSGVGVMECSHRSPAFDEIIETAEANIRSLANVPDNYHVLFLQGGASSQFFMVPMNLLPGDGSGTVDFVDTGAWTKKAIKEAKQFGTVNIAATSEAESYTFVPKAEAVACTQGAAYTHYCSNNTIFGTEWSEEPPTADGAFLVCDASSDIFSRPIDIAKHGIVFAGAQKNLGPAGCTLVIIRNDLVEAGRQDLPTMLQYRTHAAKGSRFNTPPAFAIFVVGEVIKWIIEFGGLEAIAEYNREKAALIYDYLDNSKLFQGTARPNSRSLMNITFRTESAELDAAFIKEAADKGLSGLKGHRSVGGMRASVYNAFPQAGCGRLVELMKDFESRQ